MRSLQSVSALFPLSRVQGLTAAEEAESRSRFGVNKLTPLPHEPVWRKFLGKFDEPIIKILLAASLLKIVVDLFGSSAAAGFGSLVALALLLGASLIVRLGEWLPSGLFALASLLVLVSAVLGHPSYEGLAVMIAVVLATGVSFLSEYRSDQEFDKLNARKDSIRVKVMRDGAVRSLVLEDVVVGDLVVLETGDEIPADGRLARSAELLVDQSLMTGESEPVKKSPEAEGEEGEGPERAGCLYRGTQVVDGLGEMIVTNVGDDTMLGQLARKLSTGSDKPEGSGQAAESRVHQKLTFSRESTPLQEKLAVLAFAISKVGYAAAVLIFLALFIKGLIPTASAPAEIFWPNTAEELRSVVDHLLKYIVYMVIIIVVAVPEGLPMSVTVSLALAMRKMTRANALVRQLVATETIGSATVICTDKTGTLTQNKMQVVRLGLAGRILERDDPRFLTCQVRGDRMAEFTPIRWLALNAALNSTATLEQKNGQTQVIGNSTEGALLLWLRDSGCEAAAFRVEHQILYRLAFSSEHKRMITVVAFEGRVLSLVKGAPEVLLERCSHLALENGSTRPITPDDREQIRGQLAAAAAEAKRTLAFAHRVLPAVFPHSSEEIAERRDELDSELVFAGFVGIQDPLREDVKDAVDECRAAGIEVKMITGDHVETAQAIAREIGLLDSPQALALSSAEFNALSDDEVRERLPNLRVLARARPLDKYRLVRLLQEQNHVVAMTGDGTNDAPSLKRADVGLAMGLAGTEVAKEASKIVLLDDAFSTIVKAVHWGRALYENIQRFITFQLTINVSALLITFLGPFFGLKPPFTVLQLLWINVIMDTFAAMALCSEPPRPGLMRLRPKRRDENIVTRGMLWTILATAGFYVVVMIALLKGMENFGWFQGAGARSGEFPELTLRQVAIFFTVYVFFQIWNQINCRSLSPRVSGLAGLFRNPTFIMIASLTLIGQILIVQLGGALFEVEPLHWRDWFVIASATLSVLVFAEAYRALRILLSPTPEDRP